MFHEPAFDRINTNRLAWEHKAANDTGLDELVHRDVHSHQQSGSFKKCACWKYFMGFLIFFFSPALHLFMLGAAEVESGCKFKEYKSSYHRAAENPAMAEWLLASELSVPRRLWEAQLRYFRVFLSDWPYVDGCEC